MRAFGVLVGDSPRGLVLWVKCGFCQRDNYSYETGCKDSISGTIDGWYLYVSRIARSVLVVGPSSSPRSINPVKEHLLVTNSGSGYEDRVLFVN
jgi:hypothetical protein